MGNSGSSLKKDRKTLKIYTDLTVFNETEILKLYDEFMRIGEITDQEDKYFINYSQFQTADSPELEVKAQMSKVYRIPEETFIRNFYKSASLDFSCNPFHRDLIHVFKTDLESGLKGVCFDDFLDMMNALSSKLPIESKGEWAFKTFQKLDPGVTGGDFISKLGLEELLSRMLPKEKEVGSDDEGVETGDEKRCVQKIWSGSEI